MSNAQGGQIGAQLATPNADDGPLGWDLRYRRDTGGALVVDSTGDADPTIVSATPLYIAGMGPHASFAFSSGYSGSSVGFPIQGGTLANSTICWPQILPAGKLIRILSGVVGNAAGPGAGGLARYGLYSNKNGPSNLNMYPFERLYDSGGVVFETLGPKDSVVPGGGLSLTGGLYWFVMSMNTLACGVNQQFIPCTSAIYMQPSLGKTVRWGTGEPVDNASFTIGWRHALTFGAFPQTFPSSAPVRVMNQATIGQVVPLIFFGFSTTE